MLSPDGAKQIAEQWRPKFVDETAFETSWTRFFEKVGDPTAEKLHGWLAKDQAKDAVMHAGIVKEPLLPVRQRFTIGEESDCAVCKGKRYVRRDLDIGHPDFGKAIRCPRCAR